MFTMVLREGFHCTAVCLTQILETVTERLVDGFQAMRNLFKENDPDGGEAVTQ